MEIEIKATFEDKEKLKQAIKGYAWLAEKFSKEITVIDGEGEAGEVTKRLLSKLIQKS